MSENSNNSKVFVGRLPDGCTEKDLEDLFGTYGTVNQTDLIGKYGFVHMTKREEAEEAIKKLNNYNFMGSQLTVQISTSKMNGNSVKQKGFVNKRVMNKRNTGPYSRNNSYQSSRPPIDRFGGPPPGPPNNFMPYYDDMNGYPYREPFYPEPDPYFPANRRNAPPYESPPPYGRRGPPPIAADYSPRPPAPIQPDFYGRGDGPYNRGPSYGQNRPVVPSEPPRAMGFGAQPIRNGYGSGGFGNRAPASGPGMAQNRSMNAAPPLPPSARQWQPY